MAEATVRTSLQIIKGNLNYRSNPTQFQADVSIAKGPSPGAMTASVDGVDIDLSELIQPGLCRVMNLDATNFVEVGIWDGVSFYPLMELLSGESYVFRISRNITEEFGTGTGTTGAAINTMRVKANTAACIVLVEAFDT